MADFLMRNKVVNIEELARAVAAYMAVERRLLASDLSDV